MKLPLQKFPLMGDEITQHIFQVFESHNILARFVGGCVRDAVLGVGAHDIDMAVPVDPDRISDILSQAQIKVIPTGYEFGTITAVFHERAFQITSLRQDWKTDGRRAHVIYGQSWEEDALRRDFTINALYADRDGTIHDFCGGVDDLKAGIVCFVGDAYQRIQEDYLRILRYFRFLAWYGHGSLNSDAVQACQALSHGLKGLSRERIGHEFLKLLAAQKPLPSLVLMTETGVAPFVVSQPLNIQALETLFKLEENPEVLCRLAALSLPKIDAKALGEALRLSRDQSHYLQECHDRLSDYPSNEKTLSRNLYKDGPERFLELTLLSFSLNPAHAMHESLSRAKKAITEWKFPSFPLQGKDLIEKGIKPGPRVGELLKHCEEWWIDQNFQPDREACLQWIMNKIATV